MKLALVISRCLLCRGAKAQLSSAGMVKGMRCMDTQFLFCRRFARRHCCYCRSFSTSQILGVAGIW